MQLWQWVKQLGLLNSGLYLANRLAQKLALDASINKYYFAAQAVNRQPLLPENKGRRLRVVEWPQQGHPHPCPRPAQVIADRYQQGAVCLAAYKDDEFTGCLWFVTTAYQEDEVRCRYVLPPAAVWDFDVYVDAKYRLSPVFLKLWDAASSRLLADGFAWSLSRISAFNALSLSSHKRMGAKVLGWAVFIRLRSVQFTVASVPPFLHGSFSENAFPVFRLQLPDFKNHSRKQ